MKSFFRNSLLLLTATAAFAPAKAQLKLGDNPTAIRTDAILELNSANQGLLFPRVLKAQIIAGGNLYAAPDGMMVYVKDVTEMCMYLKKNGAWVKMTDNLTVNGYSGPTINLTTGDIPEGTNLYFTNARARSAISVTGLGLSYNNTTGILQNTGVTSFNTRTGAVVPAAGDYNLGQLGDVTITSPAANQLLQYDGTKWVNWTPTFTSANTWNITGNNNITATNFFGTTTAADIIFKSNNTERGRLLSDGRWQIGGVDNTYAPNSGASLMVKNRMIIEGNGPGTNNELIFTKASTGGVMRIADDQADFQIQGGNGLNLALGASKSIVLYGDRNNASYVPTTGTSGTGVLIPAQQDGSVPLGIQANSSTQTAHLTEWRNASGTALSVMDKAGNLALGATSAARTLHVGGTMRLTGSVTGTAATSLMARDVNGDVLALTPLSGPANPNPTWTLNSTGLVINNAYSIWNANQIQGTNVPAPSGTNNYLKFDGTNLSWATVATGTTLPAATTNSVLVTGNTTSPYWTQAASTGVSLLVSGGANPYWANTTNGGILLAGSGGSSIFWSNAPTTGAGALVSSNGNPSWTGTTTNGLLMSNGTSAYWGATGNTAVLTTGNTGVMSWQSAPAGNSILSSNGTSVSWQAANFMNNNLGSAQMWVGNASGVATAVNMGGDATIDNAGALTIGNQKITQAKIANSAVGLSQLANGSNNAILTTSATGVPQWTAASANAYLIANGSGVPTWAAGTPMTNVLSNGQLWVGNASNQAAAVTMSGDATLSNSGALSIANGAVTAAKLNNMGAGSGQVLTYNGTAWAPATPAATGVTSVGLSMPGIFSVTNSPVTSTGTLTASLAAQAPNTVFAGPTSGANATPAFRALTAADIPTTLGGYIQNQFTAAQATSNFWISGNGKTGGTMEIGGTSGTTTGLKFTGINSSTTPAVSNNVMLTLDASGNVILAKNPATANWLATGNSSPGAGSFLGTITDDVMNIRSSNLPFLSFGKRGLLGLYQNYPGYQDALEKVTYIQSALQFQADAASFYKPKMWTDSLGNFHMMGPMAGTDYFEFAAGGTANAGEFDITSGDDGDEPIIFRNYNYSTSAISEWARIQQGKIGINVGGVPQQTLHVAGTMRVTTDVATTAAKVLAKDNNGDVTSVSGSSNGQVLQYNGTGWTAGPQMLHYTGISTNAVTSFSGNTTGTLIVDLSGVMGSVTIATGATIMVNFRTALNNSIAMAWVIRNANQKIQIGFTNTNSSNTGVAANTIDVTIIQ